MSESATSPDGEHLAEMLPIGASCGVIVVGGELDMATVHLLRNALEPFIRTGGRLLINLRDLTFIDSSGAHLLADTAEALGTTGRVVLVDPSLVVQRLIELVGPTLDVDVEGSGRHRAA